MAKETMSEMCMLCRELASSVDLKETLDTLARDITEMLGAKGCTIRLLDAKALTLEIVAAYGLSKSYLEKGPVHVKEHPVDRRVLDGEYIATKDITAEPHLLYLEEAKREGIKSVLSAPLSVRDKTIGVVRVYTGTPHDFTVEEIDRLKILISLGGILADRAGIWQQMRALIDIARTLSSTLSLQEVLDRITESAAKTLGMRAASIRLLDEERKRLIIKATYGLSKAYLEKGPVEVEKSPIDMLCIEGQVVQVTDISKDTRLQYPEEIMKEGIGALLSIPVSLKGAVIGVLRVYTAIAYKFTAAEMDFLSALASHGAIAIENARLFEHIRRDYEDLTRDVWKWYDWGTRFPRI